MPRDQKRDTRRIGIRESQFKPSSEVAASPWFQALSSSEQFKVEFYMMVGKEDDDEITSLDVQQSPDRVPIGRNTILSCFLPATRIFMFPPRHGCCLGMRR